MLCNQQMYTQITQTLPCALIKLEAPPLPSTHISNNSVATSAATHSFNDRKTLNVFQILFNAFRLAD